MFVVVPTTPATPGGRWFGSLLSLAVPGFGLVRAGLVARGIVWFFVTQLLWILVTLLAVWRSIPLWGVGAGAAVALAGQIAVMVDSFRPGILTTKLWAAFVVALLGLLWLPHPPMLVAYNFAISTGAMEPTLRGRSPGPADRVIVDRFSYRLSPPTRGDLLVFRTAGIPELGMDTFYVKRLVGLPREKIEIREGRLYADGRQLTESDGIPPLAYTRMSSRYATGTGVYEVPPDSYFVLGDNSPNSADSWVWGWVPSRNIFGRVSRIYYPFSRAGIPR